MEMKKIKVLLVDDHAILLEGMHLILQQQQDIEIIGKTNNGQDAVKFCEEKSPPLVIMDIKMKGINGIEATKQILAVNENIKVIALSDYDDLVYVKSMLQAGASGYLPKENSSEELVDAIYKVMNGGVYISREIEKAVVDDWKQNPQPSEQTQRKELSPRELQVLKLTAKGFYPKGIASELNISEKTVGAHRRKLMEKLGIYSVADLTKYAIRNGIISPED